MRLEPIAALFDRTGPFVSVYLDVSGDWEDAAQRLQTRWKNVHRTLADQGADEALLEQIGQHAGRDHSLGDTLAVIAAGGPDGGSVRYARHFPDPPTRDLAIAAALPRVGPILEWRQQLLPHVVVLTDRVGADVIAFVDGEPVDEEAVETADRDLAQKAAPGGWSQKRYQQRAENLWEENAKDVADVLAKVVDDIGARLVVVAGDVRAVQLLQEHLPTAVTPLVEDLGRGANPSTPIEDISDDVVKLVASRAAEDTVAVLEKFREEKGQHDRAADGPAAVFLALAEGRVETLLVHDDPDDDRTAWFGPDPFHLGLDRATVEAMGVDTPAEGRLVDIAIRTALGTSAEIRVVPSTAATDGLGAILRY